MPLFISLRHALFTPRHSAADYARALLPPSQMATLSERHTKSHLRLADYTATLMAAAID